MSLSQYELAQIVEALDTIRKRLDALEAAQTRSTRLGTTSVAVSTSSTGCSA